MANDRLRALEEVENQIATILQCAGNVVLELSKDKHNASFLDRQLSQFTGSVNRVETELSSQIRYLTQVTHADTVVRLLGPSEWRLSSAHTGCHRPAPRLHILGQERLSNGLEPSRIHQGQTGRAGTHLRSHAGSTTLREHTRSVGTRAERSRGMFPSLAVTMVF
ncbi:mediator of RNA polymerase II transcription subunit 11 isoform X1 [Oncorhynchus tshawytscha]|uniref:Mediator of RNA polymerase II transcription subunit 11 n=1 Tax=Oncorhynchus tshawytscha TaxID=74940 RepID=A0AAZ3SLU3_ONCTS|nr:mediator of RNA polymerase II transcription subunit 11 isoform X1 [Oncorhynchus tshawytscha]